MCAGNSRAGQPPLHYQYDPDRVEEVITPRFVIWISTLGNGRSTIMASFVHGPLWLLGLLLYPLGYLLRLPLLLLIQIYKRVISPLMPPACRFEPSCSVYAYHSLKIYGFFKGSVLGIFRLLRCQPFCKGGYDPVPPLQKKALDSQ
jgi:uncharacterized protein